jgi:hypothetical protein
MDKPTMETLTLEVTRVELFRILEGLACYLGLLDAAKRHDEIVSTELLVQRLEEAFNCAHDTTPTD